MRNSGMNESSVRKGSLTGIVAPEKWNQLFFMTSSKTEFHNFDSIHQQSQVKLVLLSLLTIRQGHWERVSRSCSTTPVEVLDADNLYRRSLLGSDPKKNPDMSGILWQYFGTATRAMLIKSCMLTDNTSSFWKRTHTASSWVIPPRSVTWQAQTYGQTQYRVKEWQLWQKEIRDEKQDLTFWTRGTR